MESLCILFENILGETHAEEYIIVIIESKDYKSVLSIG